MARRGYRTIKFELEKGTEASVYTSPRVADALADITKEATLYEGVKLTQVLASVYEQGKKDGAREVFEEVDRGLSSARRQIPHQRPGRPKKR